MTVFQTETLHFVSKIFTRTKFTENFVHLP